MVIHRGVEEVRFAGAQGDGGDAPVLPLEAVNSSWATRDQKWVCLCACGRIFTPYLDNILTRKTRSCGCYRNRRIRETCLTHGESYNTGNTRTYRIWSGIKTRCENRRARSWKYYGGRGITRCDRWKSYEMFLADMGYCPDGLSIDRIDNKGNYEPGNCRWATAKEQRANQGPRKLVNLGWTQRPGWKHSEIPFKRKKTKI